MKKSGFSADSPRNNAVALVLILVVGVAVGLRLWASTEMTRLVGPQHIAVVDEDLLITVGESLLRVAPDGSLRNEYPLSTFGVYNPLTDLKVAPDGDLLFAVSYPPLLRRCRLEPVACTTLAGADVLPDGRAYKVSSGPDGDRLFLSHSTAHQLLLATASGSPQPLQLESRLRFPNGLAFEGDLLWVADTNHHRLAAYRIEESAGRLVATIATDTHPEGRRARVWPTAFAFDAAERVWVVNGDNGLRRGDLLGFDQDGQPLARIALPDDADPTFLVHLDGALFVTDPDRVAVYRVDLADSSVSELGAAFATRIAGLRAERARLATLSDAALWSLFVVVMMGFAVASGSLRERLVFRRSDGRAVADEHPASLPSANRILPPVPAAHISGVTWIEPDLRTLRSLKLILSLALVGSVLLPMLVLAMLWLFPFGEGYSAHETRALSALMLVYPLVVLPVLWVARWGIDARVGVRGSLLCLRNHRGEALQFPPEEAVYTRKAVAHGPFTVMLPTGDGRERLQPFLERARYLGSIHLLIYQLQHRQPAAIIGTVVPLLGVAALYAIYRWV